MLRRILSILLVLILAAGIVYAYLVMKAEKTPHREAIDAVPKNAILIVETINVQQLWNRISTNNMIWEELQTIPSVRDANKFLFELDSSFTADSDLQKVLDKTNFSLSLHPIGTDRYEWLYSFGTPTDWSSEYVLSVVKKFTGGDFDERIYDGVQLSTHVDGKLTLATQPGLVIFSTKESLVEDAVRHIQKGNSLIENEDFKTVWRTAGRESEARIFIQHKYLFSYVSTALSPEREVDPRYALWTALDLELKPNALFLNGYSYQPDSLNYYLSVFEGQQLPEPEWLGALPSSSAFVMMQMVNNQSVFREKLNNYFEENGSLAFRNGKINNMEQMCSCDLWDTFTKEWDGRLAHVILEQNGESLEKSALNIVGLKDTVEVKRLWGDLIVPHADLPSYRGIPIYSFRIPSAIETLFGELFRGSAENVIFLNNMAVFSKNISALKSFLANYTTGRVLNNDAAFREYRENLANQSNLLIYNNISRSPMLYSQLLNQELSDSLSIYYDMLRKLQAATLQVSYSRDDLYYNNFYLKYNPVYKQETSTLWEIALESGFNFKPELLTNHYTQAMEVFIQDRLNNIYLISPTGKILWKKSLPEKIMSPVSQIDIFKNGKLQMVFNTKSTIYCLDRNGNPVEGFPVQLAAPASSPLAVFDYDQDREYRLVVACQDRTIRNFDANGNPVKGWDPDRTETMVTAPLKHIRIKTKDYIFALEKNGKVHLLTRTGETRFKSKTHAEHYSGKGFSIINGKSISETRMLYPDTLGNIVEMQFGDSDREYGLTGIAKGSFITFADIDNDSKSDYIIADENILKVFDSSRKKIFEHSFDAPITYPPDTYVFGANDLRIGVTIEATSECFLLDNEGNVSDDFPLFGNTRFSIGDLNKTGEWNLVVGDTLGNVLVYSLD